MIRATLMDILIYLSILIGLHFLLNKNGILVQLRLRWMLSSSSSSPSSSLSSLWLKQ